MPGLEWLEKKKKSLEAYGLFERKREFGKDARQRKQLTQRLGGMRKSNIQFLRISQSSDFCLL